MMHIIYIFTKQNNNILNKLFYKNTEKKKKKNQDLKLHLKFTDSFFSCKFY